MSTILQHSTALAIRWRYLLIIVAIVVAALAYVPAGRVEFDRSIENMFAANDPLLEPYGRLKRTFGGNELVLVAYDDDQLLELSGLDRMAQRRVELGAVDGVKAVMSLDQMLRDPHNVMFDSMLKLVRPQLLELLEGYTHGADGRTVALICLLEPEGTARISRRETVDRLRSAADEYPLGTIAGEPVMIVDGFRYIELDGQRLGWTSTILLGITIIFFFRSVRWVVIPILIVQWTLLVTRAVMVWSGLQLSMVSSMLTAIVTVGGVATVIHVTLRFRESRAEGLPPHAALANCGWLLAAPIFWTCVTDAVGFGSLRTARVGPVQDFGIMMVIGSLVILPAVVLLLPGLCLAGRFDADPKRAWGERILDRQLDRLVNWVVRYPRWITLAMSVVTIFVFAGAFRLEVESDFTRNFRRGSPVVESYAFVETNLGGAGVLDVIVPVSERLGSDVDWQFLSRVAALERRLLSEVVVRDERGRDAPGLTKVISLASALEASVPGMHGRKDVPQIPGALVQAALQLMRDKNPAFFSTLHGTDPNLNGRYFVRIMLRAHERQPSRDKRRIIEQVERVSREEFPGAEVTGFFVLLTSLIDSMLSDQWKTFAVATIGIGLTMLSAFRSPLMAIAALIPNALPILLITGCMGWAGVKINMGAAMIAAVSMGLSIDSSIHYITNYRRARGAGKGVKLALDAAHQSAGRAMIFASLALIIGFAALCTSQFVPTIYFGLLVSAAMLGGLVGNLILLPAVLTWMEGGGSPNDERSMTNAE